MSWLYVPGLAALNSELDSPSIVSERLVASSVQWRGKPQPLPAWSRRWRAGGFIRLLSGLTCSPSTLDRGVASFISSLRATPARITALPGSEPDQTGSASSPPRSFASPTSAGLMLSSARTYQGMRTDSLRPSSRHWKGWATALRQEYSVRPKPETPCDASDCSSWPGPDATNRVRDDETLAKCAEFRLRNAGQKTVPLYLAEVAQNWAGPQARDHFPPHSPERIAAMKAEGHGMRNLNDEAATWAAPKASDGEKGGPNQRGSKGDVPLPGQAAQWPGPSTGSNNSLRGGAQDPEKRKAGWHQVNLQDVACFFRPPSSPDQPIAGGSMSSTDGPNSNQPSAKRKLNPIFVEALMRWPTGLSGFERQETAWTRWWALMPSFVLALCSQKPKAQGTLFDDAA